MAGSRGVLLVTDAAMQRHPAPWGHPERPDRLVPVAAGVRDGAGQADAPLEERQPVATGELLDELLTEVHEPRHLARLEGLIERGGGWMDADTYLGPESLAAARLAAGATVDAALAVARREFGVAFAVVRPPGHHAGSARSAGFCLLNNVAVAVAALRREGLAQRVAIVDWDVHHGDGTQEIFDADPDLCYASTHQWPLYPGTGLARERGTGPGEGTKHNVPLGPGSGDEAFVPAWLDHLLPEIEHFAPDALLVSAGYDAHRADPLAELQVTEDGYRRVASAVGSLAARLRLPGVALTLEGGYDADALHAASAATVAGLLGGLYSAQGA